jgi:hypothetical protein
MFTDADNALAILPPPAEVQHALAGVLRTAALLRRQLRLSASAEQARLELTRKAAPGAAPADQ